MTFAIEEHAIFLTLAGSHAHGTAGASSDVDVRGVCVAPLSTRLSPFRSFEQYEGPLPDALFPLVAHALGPRSDGGPPSKVELVVYDLAKFVVMLAAQNPNALEILYSDERDWLSAQPRWRRLHAERARFLTVRVKDTYAGYAHAQLERIAAHRAWLLDPPQRPPQRADFDLPETSALSRDAQGRIEAAVRERLASFRLDDLEIPMDTRQQVRARLEEVLSVALGTTEDHESRLAGAVTRSLGVPEAVLETLGRERRYRRALSEWHAYVSHRDHRNPARAELEARFGYDTNHASHLVRLYRTGIEALETGQIRVRREDATELRAIRDGALRYDALLALASELRERLHRAAENTQLPRDVDRAHIEALTVELLSG